MAFRFDKLTQKAQEAVQQAQQMAAENGHQAVSPVHLLLALTAEREGIVRPVLEKCGLQPDGVEHEAQRQIAALPKVAGQPAGQFIAPGLQQVFEAAAKSAESFKDEFVSTEHLLLGIADRSTVIQPGHPESPGRHQRLRDPDSSPRRRARHRSASPIRTRKANIRRSSATPSISLSKPSAASSIPSSAADDEICVASCRF